MERDISFQLPYVSWLIFLLIPFFLGALALGRYRSKILSSYTSSFLLPLLNRERAPLLNMTKNVNWGVIWILGSLALMGPYGNIRYVPSSSQNSQDKQVKVIPHEVIFLVDTSASMRVKDGYQGKSRLESAKLIMEALLRGLHGELVAVYAFTSELTSVVPPTLDYIFARMAINDLQIDQGDVGGTRFVPILTALKERVLLNSKGKQYTVLMFSDGGDTKLEIPSERDHEKQAILKEMSLIKNSNLRFFTIGVGGEKGEPIPGVSFDGNPVISKVDADILKLLAEDVQGEYYSSESVSPSDLSNALAQKINGRGEIKKMDYSNQYANVSEKSEEFITDLYYQVPLGIAIFFYLFNLLLPEVRLR